MSKVQDAEGMLILGAVAVVGFLGYKLYSGFSTDIPDILNPLHLPPASDDAHIARWLIDNPEGGYLQASRWFGYTALMQARAMDEGSGTAPDPNTEFGAFLLSKYPDYSGVSGGW